MKTLFKTLIVIFALTTFTEIAHASGQWIIYQSEDFRFVCEEPCPFNRAERRKLFFLLSERMRRFEEKIGLPIPENIKPIDVHLAPNSVCSPNFERNPTALLFSFVYPSNGKGAVCARQTPRKTLKGRFAFEHELGHLYFQGRLARPIPGEEDIEEFLVSIIGAITDDYPDDPDSMCESENPISPQFKLCHDYNFDYNKYAGLFSRFWSIAAPLPPNQYVSQSRLQQLLREVGGR